MNDHNGAPGIATIQDPWRPDELRERVARGEAEYCRDCTDYEGIPMLEGRCPRCDQKEFLLGMPPTSVEKDAAAIRTALGYDIKDEDVKDKIDSHTLAYRDASRFDNHTRRGWRGFRIRLLTVSRRPLPWRALPLLWVLMPDELADDVQGTRLPLVSEEDVTEQGVVLALLWRKGEPGYLQGQWDGQLRRYQWDICDAGQIAHLRPEQREVWWTAMREAPKRGPRFGSQKRFENYDTFEQECRDLVTADGWKAALPVMSRDKKAEIWEDILDGKVVQDTLVQTLNVSQSTLSRALKEYERSHGITWCDWQRRIAGWARASGK